MRRFRGQRRSPFRVFAALAAVAAVPVLAACGGDDGEEPTPDFPLRADEACAEIATEVAETRAEVGPPASAGDAVQLIEQQLPARTEGLAQLQALRPPAELVAPWGEYVSLQERKIAALEEALGAAQGEQEEAFTDAQTEFERLSDKARTAAEEAGLEDCAELLPPAGQEDVLGAVEELLTSPNSEKVCDELLSERFVESAFGSVENCAKERGLPTAASLELLDIGGIAAVWAFVDVEVTDFFGRTEQQRIELVFEGEEDAKNGKWLVDFRDRLSVPEETASKEEDEGEEASGEEASGEEATGETTTEDTTTEATGDEELESP